MLTVGDIYIFVSDFNLALRFWQDGLGLAVTEQEVTRSSAFALLEFPDGGPALRLFGGVDPWPPGQRPETGSRPMVHFDVLTDSFDETLVRVLEAGGRTTGEVEEYDGNRIVSLADPDGNTFDLVEVPASEDSAGGESESGHAEATGADDD